jgi:hypothetical protein
MGADRGLLLGRIGQTPLVRVKGRGSGCVSTARMTCYKPGQRSRDEPKAFGWRDLIVRARILLGGPIVLVWIRSSPPAARYPSYSRTYGRLKDEDALGLAEN